MAETTIPALMLPIGRDLGPVYLDADDDPVFRVIVGNAMSSLTPAGHQVWRLAHSTPEFVGDLTRTELAQSCQQAGIDDHEAMIESLSAVGLIREVQLGSQEALNFSLSYRMLPLLLGLGRVASDFDEDAVGLPGGIVGFADPVVFELLTWAPMCNDLFSNCELLAQRVERGTYPLSMETSSARMIVANSLLSAHQLLSISAIFFDLDPTMPGGAYQPRAEEVR